MANVKVQVRRAYEDPAQGDGTRVLAGRIWPRGLTKARAALDEWCTEIAPSTELRKWHGHDPERFGDFGCRYQAELADPERAGAPTGACLGPGSNAAYRDQAARDQRSRNSRQAAPGLAERRVTVTSSLRDAPWLLGLSLPAGRRETGHQREGAGHGADDRKPGGAARAGVQEGRDTRHQYRGELGDQRRPVTSGDLVPLGGDVPDAGGYQNGKGGPGDLVEPAGRSTRHLGSEAAQHGYQRGQRELAAESDGDRAGTAGACRS
jgi:uncharacterized protein YeaO (DUF488 family)